MIKNPSGGRGELKKQKNRLKKTWGKGEYIFSLVLGWRTGGEDIYHSAGRGIGQSRSLWYFLGCVNINLRAGNERTRYWTGKSAIEKETWGEGAGREPMAG